MLTPFKQKKYLCQSRYTNSCFKKKKKKSPNLRGPAQYSCILTSSQSGLAVRISTSCCHPVTRLLTLHCSALLWVLGVLCIQPVGGKGKTCVRFSLLSRQHPISLICVQLPWSLLLGLLLLLSLLLINFLTSRDEGRRKLEISPRSSPFLYLELLPVIQPEAVYIKALITSWQ